MTNFNEMQKYFSVEIHHIKCKLCLQSFISIGQGICEICVRTDTRIYNIDALDFGSMDRIKPDLTDVFPAFIYTEIVILSQSVGESFCNILLKICSETTYYGTISLLREVQQSILNMVH